MFKNYFYKILFVTIKCIKLQHNLNHLRLSLKHSKNFLEKNQEYNFERELNVKKKSLNIIHN